MSAIHQIYQTVANISLVTKIILFIYIVLLIVSTINVKRFESAGVVCEKPTISIISIIATDIVLFLTYTLISKDTSSIVSIFRDDLTPYTLAFLLIALIFLIVVFAFLVYYYGWQEALSIAMVFVFFSVFITIVLVYAFPIILGLLILSIFFN